MVSENARARSPPKIPIKNIGIS